MLTGLYSATKGMDAATLHHEVAAQNLAFAQNPGHRKTAFRQQPFHLDEDGEVKEESNANSDGESVDFSPGRFEQTGRTLDVAVQGEGFLVLEGPGGPLYTRNGRFQVSADGDLVSADGLRVQGRGGTLSIPPGTSMQTLQITAEGKIVAGEVPIGQLDVVNFKDRSLLQRAGASLFSAPDDASFEQSRSTVVQGVYEHSNVEPVSELVSLIVASRQYEAAQQAMRAITQAVERHTNIR